MATIEFKGFEAYRKRLEALGRTGIDKAIRYAIYPAADYVADELKRATPVSDDPRTRGDLQDGLILTKFKDENGFIHTVATYEGYDHKGTPLRLVARALESGRSTPQGKVGKHPFIRRTVRRTKAKAEGLMQTALDRYITEFMRKRGT